MLRCEGNGRARDVFRNRQNGHALKDMQITEKRLRSDLAILNHGGQEAISLFLEMSKRLHETGNPDALRDWIVLAAPALPEAERNEVMVLLMYGFLYMNYESAPPSRETVVTGNRALGKEKSPALRRGLPRIGGYLFWFCWPPWPGLP